jgi:hypothetical protein
LKLFIEGLCKISIGTYWVWTGNSVADDWVVDWPLLTGAVPKYGLLKNYHVQEMWALGRIFLPYTLSIPSSGSRQNNNFWLCVIGGSRHQEGHGQDGSGYTLCSGSV